MKSNSIPSGKTDQEDSLEKEPHPEKVEVLGPMELHKKVVALCKWRPCPCGCGMTVVPSDGRRSDVTNDVTNDLNACAAFEAWLETKAIHHSSRPQDYPHWVYYGELFKVLGMNRADRWGPTSPQDYYLFMHATAEQRCRAFIATMEASSDHSGTEKQLADSSNPNS